MFVGVYSHIEPIKTGFLKRAFGNTDGDLYEGTLTDFVAPELPHGTDTRWEVKRGPDEGAKLGPALHAIAALLAGTDNMWNAL